MQRDPKIDSFRGVLIILVVLGHVIGMTKHFCAGFASDCMEYLFKLIYVFHMPAFFWLAGMTWKRREDEAFVTFAQKKFMRLIVPYIVFGVLSGVVYYFFASGFYQSISGRQSGYYDKGSNVSALGLVLSLLHAGGLPENGVLRANSVLWFLPAMFTAQVVYWVIDRFCRSKALQLTIVGVIFVCGYCVPLSLPWGISRAMTLMPYLTLARWTKGLLPSKIKGVWMVTAIICYSLTCYFTPNRWIVHKSIFWYSFFAVLSCVGIYICSLMSARFADYTWLCRAGISAMGIMLLHKFIIVGVQAKLHIVSYCCQSGLFGALFMVVLITTIAVAVSMAISAAISRICPVLIGEKRYEA